MRYFIYARKSSDSEDRQVLSIEAQLHELREFAEKEGYKVVREYKESKTAKEPGRNIFNQMMDELEAGQADGIISWSPDRLSRNSSDSGRIIYLIDKGVIKTLKFPIFWFENSSQGKFNLSIAFSQSKYMVDNLSDNVKRGIRQKLRRGEYPGPAPTGYINNLKNKTIEPDPETFEAIKFYLEKFATGTISQALIRKKLFEAGVTNKKGNKMCFSTLKHILENPFYHGLFMYNGELHQGSHQPMISKEIFDQIQERLKENPRKVNWTERKRNEKNFLFSGIGKCGECDYSITQEWHRKDSGLVFKYYRCSKRSPIYKCKQKAVNENDLGEQIKNLVEKVSFNEAWHDRFNQEVNLWNKEEQKTIEDDLNDLKKDLEAIKIRLDKLLDLQLEGDLSPEEYRAKKNKLINTKSNIEEQINKISKGGSLWRMLHF